jgi:hypothetical protein
MHDREKAAQAGGVRFGGEKSIDHLNRAGRVLRINPRPILP